MKNIIRTEWLKIKGYKAFWIVLGMTALSYPGINYMFWKIYKDMAAQQKTAAQMLKMILGNPFAFPEVFHTTAYLSSLFVFIPAIVVIMLITNEFTYKTNRQNIIDGWSRHEFMIGKLIDVFIVTLMVSILYTIVACTVGSIATEKEVTNPFIEWWYIPAFALQTFTQLSLAFFIGFIVKRAFIALSIFVFYFIIFENAAVGILKVKMNDIGRFLPFELSDRMIPMPAFMGRLNPEAYQKSLTEIQPHTTYTLILLGMVWASCFWINKKRDL